jgi:hypothetical protein
MCDFARVWSKKNAMCVCIFKNRGYLCIAIETDDLVAQLVEHIPFKDGVLGSSPS